MKNTHDSAGQCTTDRTMDRTTDRTMDHAIAIDRSHRWQAHQRLQELDITSLCPPSGELRVQVNHPVAVVQVWSVLQQFNASRPELLHWLEQCWKLSEKG